MSTPTFVLQGDPVAPDARSPLRRSSRAARRGEQRPSRPGVPGVVLVPGLGLGALTLEVPATPIRAHPHQVISAHATTMVPLAFVTRPRISPPRAQEGGTGATAPCSLTLSVSRNRSRSPRYAELTIRRDCSAEVNNCHASKGELSCGRPKSYRSTPNRVRASSWARLRHACSTSERKAAS